MSVETAARVAASAALETHANTVSAAVVVASALATTADTHANTVSAAAASIETHVNTVSNAVSVVSVGVDRVSQAVSVETAARVAASAALETHANTVSAAVVVASALATTADTHANTVSAAVVSVETHVNTVSNAVSIVSVGVDRVSQAVSVETAARVAASAALETHANTVSAAVVVASALATTADTHANTVSAAVVVASALATTADTHANTVSAAVVVASALATTADTHANTVSAAVVTATAAQTLAAVTGRGATTATAVSFTNATTATSTTTGALQVTGGTAIGENLYVGGKTVHGHTTSVLNTQHQFVSGSGTAGVAAFVQYYVASNPYIFFARSKSNTVGTATAVANGDELMNLAFSGNDGTNWIQGARIQGVVTNTVATNSVPTDLVFFTGTVSGGTERMRIAYGGVTTFQGTVIAPTFSGNATTANYADLAENYTADAQYEPGTVLQFGEWSEVTRTAIDATPKVVGVVSTDPAYLMNNRLTGEFVVKVALMGRVPCKARGPIAKGDLLVATADGMVRAEGNPKVGTVVGKALEHFYGEEGVIEIIVGLK